MTMAKTYTFIGMFKNYFFDKAFGNHSWYDIDSNLSDSSIFAKDKSEYMLEIQNYFYNTPNPNLWRNYTQIMADYEYKFNNYEKRIDLFNEMYVDFLNGDISLDEK